jgi:excisionase family DNA binding protein
MSEKTILNVGEAATYLGVSRPTVDRMRKAGQLRSTKVRNRVMFRREWLDQLIDRFAR